MGISVRELISDSDRQAEGMKLIADRVDAAAAVSLMDLSVEAECFGASIAVSQDEVPTVKGCVVSAPEEAEALAVPPVGAGRTDVNITPHFRLLARLYWRDDDFPDRVERYFRDDVFAGDSDGRHTRLIGEAKYFAQIVIEHRNVLGSILDWKDNANADAF